MGPIRTLPICVLLAAILPRVALALVNPSLQPGDLYDRHRVALGLKVAAIDEDQKTVDLDVVAVYKGEFTAKKVTLTLGNGDVAGAFQILPRKGLTIVAFVGSTARNHDHDLLFYAGGEGRWQGGEKAATDAARWLWTKDLNSQELFDIGIADI